MSDRKKIKKGYGKLLDHSEAIALIVLFIAASVLLESFFTYQNITNALRQVSMIGIISLGMTLVILTGGIDLSVGSTVSAATVVAAYFSENLILAIVMGCLTGLAVGALNGFIITKLKIAPFIGTLAIQLGVRGLVYAVTSMSTISIDGEKTSHFIFLGRGYLGIIPFPVVIMALLPAVMIYILKYTSFGRSLYAIGGNEDAARLIGIRVDRNIMLTYVITGLFSAIAGIILAARLGAGQPANGKGWEMDAVAAVAIGGTLLTGGEGGIGKTVIGVLIYGCVSNIINMQGTMNTYWQSIITGLILLAAILIQRFAHTRERKTE